VLDADGLSSYVALKLTVNVLPIWLWSGVKEKIPELESKAIF